MLVLAVFAAFLAVALILFATLSQAEEKATIRQSLRQLTGYEVENVRDRELLDPLRAIRVVTIALVPVWAVLCFALLPLEGNSKLAVFVLLALGSILGPDA